MTYEKAELILQQLMAGDRDYYLVQGTEGKPCITDRPTKQQRVVGELPKKKRSSWLHKLVCLLLCFLSPMTVTTERKALHINVRKDDDSVLEGTCN